MSELKTFSESAVKLSRNPLGIIALFIVLMYAIACLTFMFARNLPSEFIIYFIAFILVYPLIILFTFFRLVTKYHTKLYAPEDFPNRDDFLKCVFGDKDSQSIPIQSTDKPVLETPRE